MLPSSCGLTTCGSSGGGGELQGDGNTVCRCGDHGDTDGKHGDTDGRYDARESCDHGDTGDGNTECGNGHGGTCGKRDDHGDRNNECRIGHGGSARHGDGTFA